MGHWQLVKALDGAITPNGRGGHACAAVGKRVVVFGGADRSPTPYDDLWVLDTADNKFEWTRVSPQNPAREPLLPRSGATLTAVGDLLYLFGGQDPLTGTCYDDLIVIETQTWQWSVVQVSSGRPPARHGHSTGLFKDNLLLVFGGASLRGLLADVWVFNTATRQWSRPGVDGPPPSPREMHTGSMVSPTQMLVYGGRAADGQVRRDMALLDMDQLAWVSRAETPHARCAHSAVLMPTEALAACLESSEDQTADNSTWPAAGSGDTAVVLFGGYSGEAVENSVLAVHPGTLRVHVLSPSQPPSLPGGQPVMPAPRFAHCSAVVPLGARSGSASLAMVVFGGVEPAQDLHDVAVWTPAPPSAAP